MTAEIKPIRTHGPNGETAPEAGRMAEVLRDAGVEARSLKSGDQALYVADADLDGEVRRFLHDSHYTEGLPGELSDTDAYTGFKPKAGRHPDKR